MSQEAVKETGIPSDEAAKRQRIQSVVRATRMLLCIAKSASGLTATDLARTQGLTLPTAFRLLATLEDEGLLYKTFDKRYVLGSATIEIANAPGLRPRMETRHLEVLRHVAEVTRETAYLTGWFRDEIQILATVEGSQAVRVAGLQVGYAEAVHARASAKLLLAFADEHRRSAALDSHDFTPYTAQTIRTRAALERELQAIQRTGIAQDRDEYHEGVRTVSAPIYTNKVVVAALAVSAPSERFAQNERALVEAVVSASLAGSNQEVATVARRRSG
ncbi:helix-turn-helix domain-containing protein [Microbacterium sp. LRZ72]|uniref:IclR family transcriptional regulator n=1 Tax=Microbacterium sp. LRZ72 TaxID=2942481 RepID=UPI0029BA7A1F|nr:IclR family transcriptional regulator C-terminal domain-containing protein [Microbacterium sp. LRZ72]MDX2377977.1 helix-turn-helix domain-containing protein [Microbacterium sp. LRZ72]